MNNSIASSCSEEVVQNWINERYGHFFEEHQRRDISLDIDKFPSDIRRFHPLIKLWSNSDDGFADDVAYNAPYDALKDFVDVMPVIREASANWINMEDPTDEMYAIICMGCNFELALVLEEKRRPSV